MSGGFTFSPFTFGTPEEEDGAIVVGSGGAGVPAEEVVAEPQSPPPQAARPLPAPQVDQKRILNKDKCQKVLNRLKEYIPQYGHIINLLTPVEQELIRSTTEVDEQFVAFVNANPKFNTFFHNFYDMEPLNYHKYLHFAADVCGYIDSNGNLRGLPAIVFEVLQKEVIEVGDYNQPLFELLKLEATYVPLYAEYFHHSDHGLKQQNLARLKYNRVFLTHIRVLKDIIRKKPYNHLPLKQMIDERNCLCNNLIKYMQNCLTIDYVSDRAECREPMLVFELLQGIAAAKSKTTDTRSTKWKYRYDNGDTKFERLSTDFNKYKDIRNKILHENFSFFKSGHFDTILEQYISLRESIRDWAGKTTFSLPVYNLKMDDKDFTKIGRQTGTRNLCLFAWVEGMMCADASIIGMPYMVLQMIINLIDNKWDFTNFMRGVVGSPFTLVPKTGIDVQNASIIIKSPTFIEASFGRKFYFLLQILRQFENKHPVSFHSMSIELTDIPGFVKAKFEGSKLKVLPDTLSFINIYDRFFKKFELRDKDNNDATKHLEDFLRLYNLAKIRAEVLHVAVSTNQDNPYALTDAQTGTSLRIDFAVQDLLNFANIRDITMRDKCVIGLTERNFAILLAHVRQQFAYAGSKIETDDVFQHWSDERKQQVHQIIKDQKMQLIVL